MELESFRLSGDDAGRVKSLSAAERATVHAWCQDVARGAVDYSDITLVEVKS